MSPGGLMAGLAGGVLLGVTSISSASTEPVGQQAPSVQRPLASAIQSVFDEGVSLRLSREMDDPAGRPEAPRWLVRQDAPVVLALIDGMGVSDSALMSAEEVAELASRRQEEPRLLMSSDLSLRAMSGSAPRWKMRADQPLFLGLVAGIAGMAEGERGAAIPVVPSHRADAPPLRLSQMLASPTGRTAQPRWMTSPDQPTILRATRSLTMPGAAGGGRVPPQGVQVPVAGVDMGEDGEDGIGRSFTGQTMVSSSASSATPAVETKSRGVAGTGWEIPPIRWGGSLGYSTQRTKSEGGASSASQGLSANLNASSYIYAPWFATVSGRLGIVNSSSESPAAMAGGSSSSQAANIIGGGEINAFSSTRFPFRAYFDRSDSRVSGSVVKQDYVNTRFGINQSFTGDDGLSTGNFMLDRSNVATSDGKSDTVTALTGAYSVQRGLWQHSLSSRYSLAEREGTGEGASLFGFNSQHNANFSETANLSTMVTFSDNDYRTAASGGGMFSNRGRFLQVYTYGSWMPEFEDLDDLPLTLNGSVRYTNQETMFGSSQTSSQTVGGNLSALYRFSNRFSASANSALNQVFMSNGASQLVTLFGGNLNYVGAPLSFGKVSYNWNTGGGANWQGGTGEVPSNMMMSMTGAHSLSRVYPFDNGQSLSLSFSQTVTAAESQMVGNTQSLSNNFSANYGLSMGERFSGSLSGMLSDVYSTGYVQQHYKNMNLGLVGMGQVSQLSSLNFNLMFNWSDQQNQTLDAFGVPQTTNAQNMALNGSANYTHSRFAGVRGLRYEFIFAADTRMRDDRLYGNFNTGVDRSRYTLTNRLDYVLGQLNFRLSMVENEVGGKKNALLFFQVTRRIGAY